MTGGCSPPSPPLAPPLLWVSVWCSTRKQIVTQAIFLFFFTIKEPEPVEIFTLCLRDFYLRSQLSCYCDDCLLSKDVWFCTCYLPAEWSGCFENLIAITGQLRSKTVVDLMSLSLYLIPQSIKTYTTKPRRTVEKHDSTGDFWFYQAQLLEYR